MKTRRNLSRPITNWNAEIAVTIIICNVNVLFYRRVETNPEANVPVSLVQYMYMHSVYTDTHLKSAPKSPEVTERSPSDDTKVC